LTPSRIIVSVLALLAAIAAACSGSSSSSTATPQASVSPAASVAAGTTPSGTLGGGGTANPPSLQSQGGLTVIQIADKLAPSIVRVQTEGATLDVFGRTTPAGGVGTGVIIDTDGHIVTNNHVVTIGNNNQAADRITVTLSDQRTATATIVGRDQPTDLAVLKIDLDNLTPASFADASNLQVGQDVVAIGYALDLKGGPSVTRGVLSAKNRTINEQPYTINDAIQTDAGINPGNSGGPLVDASGKVVGINPAIIQGAQNIGFSISAALVEPTVQELIQNGRIERAFFGVGTVDVTKAIAQNFRLPVDSGVALTQVAQGSPAADAGLRTNDVIVAIDGKPIANNGDLLSVLADHKPGDQVSVDYYRGSDKQTAQVALSARPGE
jgi:S1-C subfamily serine protease